MKKLLAIILCLAVCAAPFTVFARTYEEDNTITSGNYKYILNGGNAQIIRYIGKEKSVVVPSELDGHKVVKVGCELRAISTYYGSFESSTESKEKSMCGEFGFAGTDVTSVSLPDTVTELAASCFYNCKKLEKVNLGNKLRYIPALLFQNCKSLKSVRIPSSVRAIYGGFGGTAIKKLHIPEKVSYIDVTAFGRALEKFTVAKDNRYYSSKNGVLYNKKKTILHFCPRSRKAKSLKIPETVKKIRTYACARLKNLTKLTVPKSVREIQYGVFENCKKLRTAVFKERGKLRLKLAQNAFRGCGKLRKKNLPANVEYIFDKTSI